MNKTLIELMLEANVEWPEGAEFAAQDSDDNRVFYYHSAPIGRTPEGSVWRAVGHAAISSVKLGETAKDQYKYISREEYEAAQDKAERDRIFGYADEAIDEGETPEQEKDKEMTIEQKIKDMVFHQESIARYQEQIGANQTIVDNLSAEIAADLAALGWGEQPNGCAGVLEITDWRQLKVGDIIEPLSNWDEQPVRGHQHEVTMIDRNDPDLPILIDYNGGVWGRDFKFISRPSANK